MRTRIDFRNMLEETVGPDVKLYFQPPEGQHLSYPCIIYNRYNPITRHGNNKKFVKVRGYEMTLILLDPEDSELVEKLENLEYCRPEKPFISDSLYHYPFTIYY